MFRQLLMKSLRATLALVLLLGVLAFAAPGLTPTPGAATKERVCSWDGGKHPTIQAGDKGKAVRHAQCLLNAWNGQLVGRNGRTLFINLAEDGDFRGLTDGAVRDFQYGYGLKQVDGIIGTCTWLALHPHGKDPGPACFPSPPPILA